MIIHEYRVICIDEEGYGSDNQAPSLEDAQKAARFFLQNTNGKAYIAHYADNELVKQVEFTI